MSIHSHEARDLIRHTVKDVLTGLLNRALQSYDARTEAETKKADALKEIARAIRVGRN